SLKKIASKDINITIFYLVKEDFSGFQEKVRRSFVIILNLGLILYSQRYICDFTSCRLQRIHILIVDPTPLMMPQPQFVNMSTCALDASFPWKIHSIICSVRELP
ncbi:hypothetical protein ACJX0J_033944, partial [Zea mays]